MNSVHPYARHSYAIALAGKGVTPLEVEAWGTSVLRRQLSAGGADGAGPYPVTVLRDGADVAAGLDALAKVGLISVVLVADPLSPLDPGDAFDIARPFKTHHLVHPGRYAPSKHHRAEIRRSLARCTVERVSLTETLPVWSRLYGGLIERHSISGVSSFSPAYFEHLAAMHDLVALAARIDGEIVAMGLWFAHDGVACNHLGASSPAGYAAGASYALYDAAIAHFSDCRVVNLGGGAGATDDPDDGLARFKRGFADDAAQSHLYGAVLDRPRYAQLSSGVETDFFPAYRDPSAGLQSLRTVSATLVMSSAS